MADEIRVVLADDHPIVLEGLKTLLGNVGGFAVAGQCRTGREVFDTLSLTEPDILLLDLKIPGMSGIEILRQMRLAGNQTKVVVLTASLDEDEVTEIMRLGVKGVVLKEMASELLVGCLRKVHAGGNWFEMQSMGKALEKLIQREESARNASSLLSARELEVVSMTSEGLRNKEIADRLNVSEGTVKVHLHNIYEKLNLSGRMALLAWARRNGLA